MAALSLWHFVAATLALPLQCPQRGEREQACEVHSCRHCGNDDNPWSTANHSETDSGNGRGLQKGILARAVEPSYRGLQLTARWSPISGSRGVFIRLRVMLAKGTIVGSCASLIDREGTAFELSFCNTPASCKASRIAPAMLSKSPRRECFPLREMLTLTG